MTYRAFFNQVSETLRGSCVGVGSRNGGALDKILGGGHCLLDMLEPELELLLQLQNALEVVEPGFQFRKNFFGPQWRFEQVSASFYSFTASSYVWPTAAPL